MPDPPEPLILGFDSEKRSWSDGVITAKVRSISEPDRAVPLTAKLVVVPDILDYALDAAETETFRATVTLKPVNQLPADDRAQVTIIADPLMEMGLQIMSAVGGMALPPLFKNLRAQVQVHLVPYFLQLKAFSEDRELEVGSQLSLEGDCKTPVRLEAAVYRVDGRGVPGEQPLPIRVDIKGALQDVKRTDIPSPEGGTKVELVSQKPVLSSPLPAGSLTVEATLPGGRKLTRTLTVQVKALTVDLALSPVSRVRLGGEPPKLMLTIKNSQGKAVQGLNTYWELEPPVGSLSRPEASTDAGGQVLMGYTMPTAEQAEQAFTADTLALHIKVTAGPDKKPIGNQTLTLEYFAVVVLEVEKAGFTPLRGRRVELTRPGGISVVLTAAAGKKDPIAHAKVTGLGQQCISDDRGQAALKLGVGNPSTALELSLQVDVDSQNLIDLIAKSLTNMQQAAWTTAFVAESSKKVENFARVDYVTRLAEEKPEEYQDSFLNLKALYPVIHVGELSVALFERRYARFRDQLSACFGNLAGAFYTWLGEKYFPKIGAWLGDKMKGLLRYVAGKISGQAWLLKRVRGAVGTVRGWLNQFAEKLQALKRKVGAQRSKLPESLDQKLDQHFELPNRPGMLAPGEEALKAVEEAASKATNARTAHLDAGRALDAVKREAQELQESLARAQAAAQPDASEISRLQGRLQQVGQDVNKAGEALQQAEKTLNDADKAAQAARTSYEDLKNMCSSLDELLGAFMQALSKLYEYGAWLLAYLILNIGARLMTNVRTVMGGVHPGAPDAMGSAIDDLVTKQAFTKAFELGGYYIVGPAIYYGLLIYQGYAISVAMEEAQAVSGRWEKRDVETMKAAIRWWYEDIDAASFKTEESEVWLDLAADLADWLEWLMVWITRLVNILLGIVGAVVSLLTLGAGLPAWLLVSAGFSAFMEAMDRFWDIIKAVGRSGTALMGAAEVWGVVLPAHRSFTAKIYGDPGLAGRIDRAWTYPIGAELDKKLAYLRKPGTFPGETILQELNDKLESLGTQISDAVGS